MAHRLVGLLIVGFAATMCLSSALLGSQLAQSTNKTGDPSRIFDMLAKGRDYFLVTDTQSLRAPLTHWAEKHGVKDGKITRELFAAFVQHTRVNPPGRDEQPGPTKLQELTKVLQEIEAKEKDLAALRQKADALRQEIAGLGKKESVKQEVLTSVEQIVQSLPANARPRGPEDQIQRLRANNWLAENMIGRRIQLKFPIASVTIMHGTEQKKYTVQLRSDVEQQNVFGVPRNVGIHPASAQVPFASPNVRFLLKNVDDMTAEQFQALKGLPATFVAELAFVSFEQSARELGELRIGLKNVVINGTQASEETKDFGAFRTKEVFGGAEFREKLEQFKKKADTTKKKKGA